MATNEDILMQFSAQDDVTSVIEGMESSVTAALESISQAMDNLDLGLSNLASTSEAVSSAFGEMEDAFISAESSADDFQSTLSGINGDNLSNVASDIGGVSSELSGATDEANNLSETLSEMDGTTISVDIESSGISSSDLDVDAELSGEATGQDTSALRTSMYDDLVGMSDSVRQLGNTAVESASAAEQGWLRFGNAVNNSGGNWEAQESSIKAWVKTYSNNLGRGVADTRTAMTQFLNMGMTLEDTQDTMKAVSNYAAQFGMTQSQAAQSIQMAFMGAGRSVKKLGLDIADFKDEAGNVDREKLLAAIMEKTSGAADKYADSYEARIQKMNNAIASLKTDFGKEIINTIEPLIPIVQQAVGAFTSLPQPIKSTVLAFGGLAGGVAIVAGPLLKYKAYAKMAGADSKSLVTGLKTLHTGFKTLTSGGGISQAITAMKNFAKASKEANVGNVPSVGKGMGTVASEAEKTVGSAGKVGGLSGAANSAGAGMQSTSAGLKGIGQGAMSMLAPLLEIAIVVAVLIPVITALAAEALIFLKGIQLLIDALDFDSIDLKPTIESIKQIGQALLEMGIAMGEMAFSNVMTGVAILTTGVTGLINPVEVAGKLLIDASEALEVFNEVEISSAVPENIKKISKTLKLVSDAMTSLTSVVLNMAAGNILTLGGLLGNVNTAIRTAREELIYAAQEIDKIKDVPDLDEGAVDKLEKISKALDSVATAMDALRSLRDGYNWDEIVGGLIQGIFGGADIQSALLNIKSDVYKAATALSQFTGITEIPDDVSNKLRKVADTLKSVSESVETLRGLRDDYNWDSSWGKIFEGTDIVGALNSIRDDLFKVSAALRTLNDMSSIPEGTGQKIQRVAWTTNNVVTAVNSLKNLQSQLSGSTDLSQLTSNVSQASQSIRRVAASLRPLSEVQIPEGLGNNIQRVTWSTNNVASAVRAMNSVPTVAEDTTQKVTNAVTSVRNAAKQLNKLSGVTIGSDIGQILTNIRSALTQVRSTLNSMGGGFRATGVRIGSNVKAGVNQGLAGLNGTVTSKVSAGMNAGTGVARAGGARIGAAGKAGFQSQFKLAQIASSELTYATQALQNGSGAFIQVVHDIAEQAVQEAQNTIDQHSPGRIARMWGAEMGYSSMLINNEGQGVIRSIQDITRGAVDAFNPNLSSQLAFNSPDLNAGRLNAMRNLNNTQGNGQNQNPVTIIINEGAIKLDARNLTTTESRQIILNGLEGLEDIQGIIL